MGSSRILTPPSRGFVIDTARRQLALEGWPSDVTIIGADVVTPGPLTANFLLQTILHGKRFGQIGPNSRVLLEDPKYTRPWDVRGVRFEADDLLLDVWGA